MPKYWECIECGYYITLEDCTDNHCNGSELLDEIIDHYSESSNSPNADHTIIIDIYQLEHNLKEYFKFRTRMDMYLNKGFTIHQTF